MVAAGAVGERVMVPIQSGAAARLGLVVAVDDGCGDLHVSLAGALLQRLQVYLVAVDHSRVIGNDDEPPAQAAQAVTDQRLIDSLGDILLIRNHHNRAARQILIAMVCQPGQGLHRPLGPGDRESGSGCHRRRHWR